MLVLACICASRGTSGEQDLSDFLAIYSSSITRPGQEYFFSLVLDGQGDTTSNYDAVQHNAVVGACICTLSIATRLETEVFVSTSLRAPQVSCSAVMTLGKVDQTTEGSTPHVVLSAESLGQAPYAVPISTFELTRGASGRWQGSKSIEYSQANAMREGKWVVSLVEVAAANHVVEPDPIDNSNQTDVTPAPTSSFPGDSRAVVNVLGQGSLRGSDAV